MQAPCRYKNEDDMAEKMQQNGEFQMLEIIDPDEKIILRRSTKVGDVDVTIWRSDYHPIVEMFFPQISNKDMSYSQRSVSIKYIKDGEGMRLVSVDYMLNGGRDATYNG